MEKRENRGKSGQSNAPAFEKSKSEEGPKEEQKKLFDAEDNVDQRMLKLNEENRATFV